MSVDPGRRVDAIRRELVGAHRDGYDVGEVLVLAVAAAARQVRLEGGPFGGPASLDDNRPGSWEAAILRDAISGAGELR